MCVGCGGQGLIGKGLWELNREIEISYALIMGYMVYIFVKTHQTVYLRPVHFTGHKLLS